jgi:hypothetical protein
MSSQSTRTSDPKGSQIFSNAISDPKPKAKDAIMTAGQKLLEQGRRQGIPDVLLRLLRQRFGDAVDARVEQRVATVAVEQLEAWCMRLISATTLAEVIAD